MAKFQFVKDTTSQTVLVFIQDSSSTTGAGLTGLTSGSAGLTAYYYREGAGTGATQIALVAAGSLGTWESGGFFEVDATDMPGWYELGIPNAALATGADFVGIQLKGATNMAQCNLEIQLTGIDVNDATDGGMASVADWTNGGRLDLLLDAIKVVTDAIGATGTGLSAIPWNPAWDAEIQSEVQDALDAAAAEPTGVPAANASLLTKIGVLYMMARNAITVTSTKKTYFGDDGASEFEKDLSDDGVTYTESEVNAI